MQEKIEEIKKEIGIVASLEALKDSEGGKILIKTLEDGVLSAIDKIATNYKTFSLEEFITVGAALADRLDLLRMLTRSSEDKQELNEELKRLIEL